MDIRSSSTPAQTAGQELASLLEQYREVPTLVLCSGGSALAMLEHVPSTALHAGLTIGVIDERFTPQEADRNWTQLAHTDIVRLASASGVPMFDTTHLMTMTLTEAGLAYEEQLRSWRAEHPTGVVIVTLGAGVDGHTAGIFKGQAADQSASAAWVVAYEVPPSVNPHTQRITVTYTFLRSEVTAAILYLVGPEKHSIKNHLLTADCTVDHLPVCVCRELSHCVLITDEG